MPAVIQHVEEVRRTIKSMTVPAGIKHLPGRHDQLTHGRGMAEGRTRAEHYSYKTGKYPKRTNPPASDELWSELMSFMDSFSKVKRSLEGRVSAGELADVYESRDTVSFAELKDSTGGFQSGHPLANVENRRSAVLDGAKALSYSNIVGLGGALREAALLMSGGKLPRRDIYDHFKEKLNKGVTLEDILQAMYVETQGILEANNVDEVALYRGTHVGGRTNKFVNLRPEGLTSWTASEYTAEKFGRDVIRTLVPREQILSIPSLMPKQLSGVPSFLGGGRNESEFVVLGVDTVKALRERIDER